MCTRMCICVVVGEGCGGQVPQMCINFVNSNSLIEQYSLVKRVQQIIMCDNT